ncbi:MAG TPA: hypothetical protein VFX03_15710, partial [Thermomicrobiales bacterium]|nr:hypothetical protein [Thermomicrobiales bacterium]
MTLDRIVTLALGVSIIYTAGSVAVRSFMLSSSDPHIATRLIFRATQEVFQRIAICIPNERRREALLSLFAPLCLLEVLGLCIALVGFGYALIFHAAGGGGFYESLYYSASSISTLGFAEPPPRDVMLTMLTVFEAMSSAVTISLLIGYLPNVYSAYREREQAVMRLDAEVDDAASGVNILEQLAAAAGLDHLDPIWGDWSDWFAGVAASHQTISGALFLRSPGGRTSWLATAGGILDAAAIALAALQPTPPQAAKIERCLSTGARALWLIADALHLHVDPNPAWPATPITVSQAEFCAALDALQQAGLPV